MGKKRKRPPGAGERKVQPGYRAQVVDALAELKRLQENTPEKFAELDAHTDGLLGGVLKSQHDPKIILALSKLLRHKGKWTDER